ncbi:MAG: hypothetical protein PGN33_14155 [Methylobacterium radiotolerans]
MRWLLIPTFVIGAGLIGIGIYELLTGLSSDERMGGVIPAVIGSGLLIFDVIVAFGWMVMR